MNMLTSRVRIPGGWDRDDDSSSQRDARTPRTQPDNLIAGIINESGTVVDDTGRAVARITGDLPVGSLVGHIVTSTGNILGETGEVVGRALPLESVLSLQQQEAENMAKDGSKQQSEGGGGLLGGLLGGVAGDDGKQGLLGGVGQTVKGVTGLVGDTVNTVNTLLPISNQLTRIVGLGDKLEKGEKVLGEVPEGSQTADKGDVVSEERIREIAELQKCAQEKLAKEKGEEGEKKGKEEKEMEKGEKKDEDEQESGGELVRTRQHEDSSDNATESTEAPINLQDHEEEEKESAEKEEAKEKDVSQIKNTQDKDVESEVGEKGEEAEEAKTEEIKTGEFKEKTEDTPEDTPELKTPERTKSQVSFRSQKSDTKSSANLPDESVAPGDAASQVEMQHPFEQFPGAHVEADGRIVAGEGSKVQSIGVLEDGRASQLAGRQVDADGNIVNETGTVVGHAELKDQLRQELEEEAARKREEEEAARKAEEENVDYSVLKDMRVNKAGNLVNDKGEVIGRLVEGILTVCVGRKADENGEIWNDAGKVVGKSEPIPEKERMEFKEPAPFEDFEGAVVESDGRVLYQGEPVGRVIEGDAKALKGKKVDPDGDICDRSGNVLGKAERWEPEPEAEPEPEPVKDQSLLAGKRVNKSGNVVDSNGQIFGRIIEGDVKRLVGRMCDREGNVRSESGDVIGKADLLSEGEREGFKDGPFAELEGCTVSKGGKVTTAGGDVVGRLVKGDEKALVGRSVDDDGDVLDRNGNVIGHAERWEEPEPEPEPEKEHGPMFGRKVNREGNVVDADGNLIGKLTTGEISICSGKAIDDDGDVVDSKGNTVGHVSLLADIPPTPEPEETAEEKAKREEIEHETKLAKQMAAAVEGCLEKIRPICKMINDKVDAAERKPKEELDEEELVKQVKPLIEEGGKILNEANGVIRALDPDGHIAANAKSKAHTREATPEEFHLADVLKELTGTVTECIDSAKRKIEDMPHVKEQLNPLWGLLTEPLFQILAAVGLLLNGVLELVGRLLSGLGLGGIINNLLGGLGLTNVLKSLGVGGVVDALTGKSLEKGGKKKKMGFLGF